MSTLLESLPGIANVLRSPVADALVGVIRAAARLEEFEQSDAEELVQYATRRGLLEEDEGERLLAETAAAYAKRRSRAADRAKRKRAKARGQKRAKPVRKAAKAKTSARQKTKAKAAKPAKSKTSRRRSPGGKASKKVKKQRKK